MSSSRSAKGSKKTAPRATRPAASAGAGEAAGKPRGESPDERKKRALKIIALLKKGYPDADCALKHASALQLLIATILSAQSTDETVNKVTPVLFARFPSAADLAGADPAEVERIVHATGFFRQKTKSIIGACRQIVQQFHGEVPATIDELTQLPGVARKTANVLLGTWFHKNDGVVVDTHIGRLSHRLGLTWTSKDEKDAVKIEQDLMQVLPQPEWTYAGHALIWHGRRVCSARKPQCATCTLKELCPAAFSFDGPAKSDDGKAKASGQTKAKRS